MINKQFPVKELCKLDFGSADGARDSMTEKAFVKTSSVEFLSLNKHAIICGPIGSGKSAIFKLLKDSSSKLEMFSGFTPVPIEEAISFKMLKKIVDSFFFDVDSGIVYQLIWKFHIITRICEEIATKSDFPINSYEKEINNYLKIVGAKGSYASILDKMQFLIENNKLELDATILHVPFNMKFGISKDNEDANIEINLDKVLESCKNSLENRRDKVLVLIDKIDKFVAGEEYDVQRKYIEGLLNIEEDISSIEQIFFKIFIRADLFARLNFTGLGYDKVNDNTLRLEWSSDEIINFLSSRISEALKAKGIIESKDIILSTNLTDYHLAGMYILRLFPKLLPKRLYDELFDLKVINKERKTSLKTYLNKSMVKKVFPRKIEHLDVNGNKQFIDIFLFITTHFMDGHGLTTPRRLLIFLKEVNKNAVKYYNDNPDQTADIRDIEGNKEWDLYKAGCVYRAYRSACKICIKSIGNADDEWTRLFVVFHSKKGNKIRFGYNWLESNIKDVSKEKLNDFISFLLVIGYLKIYVHSADITKRKYELPTLYRGFDDE